MGLKRMLGVVPHVLRAQRKPQVQVRNDTLVDEQIVHRLAGELFVVPIADVGEAVVAMSLQFADITDDGNVGAPKIAQD